MLRFSNLLFSGLFFGVLQWSAFFLLQAYLASTAMVYLLATSVWLLGSLAGLSIPGRSDERSWLAAATAAYYVLRALAVAHPYDFAWLPLLLGCVAVMGAYAGRFFRERRAMPGGARRLFFLENTGFLGGMVLTVMGLFWIGAGLLLLAPAIGAALCLITLPPPISRAASGESGR